MDIVIPKKNHKKQKDLDSLIKIINESIENTQISILKIFVALDEIESKGLYLHDNCQYFNKFLMKNNYDERLNLSVNTISRRVRIVRFCRENKFSESTNNIGWTKLKIIVGQNISDEKKVIELGKLPALELKKKFYDVRDKSGRLTKVEKYNRRTNTEESFVTFEIPNGKKTEFETDLVRICAKHKVYIYQDKL